MNNLNTLKFLRFLNSSRVINNNIINIRLFATQFEDDPFSRTLKILRKDMSRLNYLLTGNKESLIKANFFPRFCDILILGGGVLGSAIAYHLQERCKGNLTITLIDNLPVSTCTDNAERFRRVLFTPHQWNKITSQLTEHERLLAEAEEVRATRLKRHQKSKAMTRNWPTSLENILARQIADRKHRVELDKKLRDEKAEVIAKEFAEEKVRMMEHGKMQLFALRDSTKDAISALNFAETIRQRMEQIKLNKYINNIEKERERRYAESVKQDTKKHIKEMEEEKQKKFMKERKYRKELLDLIEERAETARKERELRIQTEIQDHKNMNEELELTLAMQKEVQKQEFLIQKKNYEQSLKMVNEAREHKRLLAIDDELFRKAIEDAKRNMQRLTKFHADEECRERFKKMERISKQIQNTTEEQEEFEALEAQILAKDMARQERNEMERHEKDKKHHQNMAEEVQNQEKGYRLKLLMEAEEARQKLKKDKADRFKEVGEFEKWKREQTEKKRQLSLQRRKYFEMQAENSVDESTLAKEYMLGCLRQQFSLVDHIKMAQFSSEFLRNVKEKLEVPGINPPDIQYTPSGSLILAGPEEAEDLYKICEVQSKLGVQIEVLTKLKLEAKFPWMNTEGIEFASLGLRNEGWFDVVNLREAYRMKSVYLGTNIIHARPVSFSSREQHDILMDHIGKDQRYKGINEIIIETPEKKLRKINFGTLIITETGGSDGDSWIQNIAQMAGIGNVEEYSEYLKQRIPITKRHRKVFTIYSPQGPYMNTPIILDNSGLYFRREGLGGEYVCSMAHSVDENNIKEETLQAVAKRIPSLADAKVSNEFTCELLQNTFDGCGMMGPHPHFTNIYFACGFNGLEMQMAPALGHAITDMLFEGNLFEVDVQKFSLDRFFLDKPIYELISI